MSTIEKLFVQIFERKNWIIEQVKQQAHLYDQHLASKLLVRGVHPPSWLWTSDPKALKKEELIAELLQPHPRITISYSSGQGPLYRDPVGLAYGEPPEGIFMEPHDSKKDCEAVPQYRNNNTGNVSNRDAELESMPTPQDQTDARITESYSGLSQSLARIQRSRSRQRAMELRNSAKTKNCDSNTKISSGITWSRSASQQLDCENKISALLNTSDFNESGGANEANVLNLPSEGKDKSIYSGIGASSEASYQQPTHMNKSSELESSDIANDDLQTGGDIDLQNLLGFEMTVVSSESKQKNVDQCEVKVTDLDNHESGPPWIGTSDIPDHEKFDNSSRVGPENNESILLSDCDMVVKPTQLDFDNLEECGGVKKMTTVINPERCARKEKNDGWSQSSQLHKRKHSREQEVASSFELVASWPQYKRRKIEGQQSNLLSSPQNIRVKPFYNVVEDTPTGWSVKETPEKMSTSRQLSNLHDMEIARPDVNKSIEAEWQQDVLKGDVIPGYEFSPQFQCDEDGHSLEGRDDSANILSTIENPQVEDNKDNLITGIPEENGLLLSYSSGGSEIGVDQAMPVFERFIIDGVRENLVFDESAFPNITLERARILEHLCKSASPQTPLSHFSTAYRLQRTPLYQSVPNGVLEHIQKASNSFNTEGLTSSSHAKSYSDSFWNIKKPYSSPIRKVYDRSISKSVGSSKQSLNPELTCFPIEEDFVIDEETGEVDEMANTFGSLVHGLVKGEREPLVDITAKCNTNLKASVCEAKISLDRDSLDSVNTDISFTGKKPKHGTCGWTNEAKENFHLSMDGSGVKKSTQLLDNRFSKPILSGKDTLREGGGSLSEKESKSNNIVSNMKSFLPFVQQKQGAAAVTGKRDVKVKALEVAEATKRLEEKRDNERKMKKEALKLERAEKKKKNEDERKRREAEVAAKKRVKEEEDRKGKERKRKRIKETQGDSEEKMLAEKEDEIAKHQKMEEGWGEDFVQDCQALNDCLGVRKGTSCFDRATKEYDSFSTIVREESYAISPYQGSDDDEEDEEEDEIPNTKFVPSWASKSSLAPLLSSLRKVDPYKIFPPESFCSIAEVLLPRKQKLK